MEQRVGGESTLGIQCGQGPAGPTDHYMASLEYYPIASGDIQAVLRVGIQNRKQLDDCLASPSCGRLACVLLCGPKALLSSGPGGTWPM